MDNTNDSLVLPMKHKRHWSFVVCDPRYLYPIVITILCLGIGLAIYMDEPEQINRVGNFIIGTGVWMSMRFTLREGINRYKNALDSSPTLLGPGPLYAINADYFNKITFSLGDAHLQIKGFIIIILGSIIGSYGDLAYLLVKELIILISEKTFPLLSGH